MASTATNANCRPRHCIRAKAYATGTQDTIVPTVVSTATCVVFQVYRSSGISLNTSR